MDVCIAEVVDITSCEAVAVASICAVVRDSCIAGHPLSRLYIAVDSCNQTAPHQQWRKCESLVQLIELRTCDPLTLIVCTCSYARLASLASMTAAAAVVTLTWVGDCGVWAHRHRSCCCAPGCDIASSYRWQVYSCRLRSPLDRRHPTLHPRWPAYKRRPQNTQQDQVALQSHVVQNWI